MGTAELHLHSIPEHMTVHRCLADRDVRLALDGEIDIASAPALEHALQEAERSAPDQIVLDFSGVRFIDSTGLAVLIRAQRSADRNGHRLVLSNVHAQALRLFRLTRLDDRLTVV